MHLLFPLQALDLYLSTASLYLNFSILLYSALNMMLKIMSCVACRIYNILQFPLFKNKKRMVRTVDEQKQKFI